MLKGTERLHSASGRRKILVVDDEFVNREVLRAILEGSYDLVFAEDGQQALDMMHAHARTLSLVLLDIMMPVMSGMEVLRQAKADPTIAQIPIIVITSDQDAEVESLSIGAIDFIPKPYPNAGVILARILTPEDFGIVAIAQVFVTFFALFQDMGLGSAIIQRQDLGRDDVSGLFGFSVALGVVLATLFASLGLSSDFVGLFLAFELLTANYNAAYGALQMGLEAIESAACFDAIDMDRVKSLP